MNRKLTKSDDRKVFGVCAGMAEYFDVDPTLIRVGWACITVFGAVFPGVVLYFVLALIMPSKQ